MYRVTASVARHRFFDNTVMGLHCTSTGRGCYRCPPRCRNLRSTPPTSGPVHALRPMFPLMLRGYGLNRHGAESRRGTTEGSNERAYCSPIHGLTDRARRRLVERPLGRRIPLPYVKPDDGNLARRRLVRRRPRHPDPRHLIRRWTFLRSAVPHGYRPGRYFFALEANELYVCSLSSQHFSVELPRNRLRLQGEALEASDDLSRGTAFP